MQLRCGHGPKRGSPSGERARRNVCWRRCACVRAWGGGALEGGALFGFRLRFRGGRALQDKNLSRPLVRARRRRPVARAELTIYGQSQGERRKSGASGRFLVPAAGNRVDAAAVACRRDFAARISRPRPPPFPPYQQSLSSAAAAVTSGGGEDALWAE